MSEGIYTRPEPTNDTYETLTVSDPGNTAQHAASDKSKKNCFRAAAVCLLCLIPLAGIIGVVIYNLTEEKNNLTKHLDHLQSRYNNVTDQKDQLQSSFDHLQSRYNTITAERDAPKRRLCEPHGFTFADGVCYYYISNTVKTWEESRQDCRVKQSDLMTMKSKEKQDFVKRVVKRGKVWLGLTDTERDGVWKWVDGTPLTTPTYWRTGEPNNIGREHCAEFVNGKWNNVQCSTDMSWICERVY